MSEQVASKRIHYRHRALRTCSEWKSLSAINSHSHRLCYGRQFWRHSLTKTHSNERNSTVCKDSHTNKLSDLNASAWSLIFTHLHLRSSASAVPKKRRRYRQHKIGEWNYVAHAWKKFVRQHRSRRNFQFRNRSHSRTSGLTTVHVKFQ